MYEREKVGISLEMLLCFLLGFTIHLFSDGSGDTDGSGDSDGSVDSNGSGDSDGSVDLDGAGDSDGSGDTDGSGVSGDTGDLFSVVGKSTKFAQFWLRIYKIGSKVFSY